MGCEHSYTYAGLRYHDGTRRLPGSGSHRRYYAHVYFCSKCLHTTGKPVAVEYNSYMPVTGGATPGTPGECGVPLEDR